MNTRGEQALVARVYATLRTDKLTALAARFRQAQAEARQADVDADYIYNHPRRRWHLFKALERHAKAEAEMMAAFAALLAECKELDAKPRQGFVCGPDGCQPLSVPRGTT